MDLAGAEGKTLDPYTVESYLGKVSSLVFSCCPRLEKKRARVLCFFVWRQLYDWVLEIETITGVKTAFLDLSQAARCLDLKF